VSNLAFDKRQSGKDRALFIFFLTSLVAGTHQ
jgi:hypothetical protein